MWLQWLKDEKTISSTPEERLELLKLFEKALFDYKYPLISLKYCKLLIKLCQEKIISVAQLREKYEDILQLYGLDF